MSEGQDKNILVCLSASPSNHKVIESAGRMAEASHASLCALFVETPHFRRAAGQKQYRQLDENRTLAMRYGARVETVYGDNVAYQIGEYARLNGISLIILGESPESWSLFRSRNLARDVMSNVPDIEVCMIAIRIPHSYAFRARWILRGSERFHTHDLLISAGLIALATVIGLLFSAAHMGDSNIIPLYILAVLAIAVLTSSQIYSMSCSLLTVFVFNYFFTEPRFSLRAYDPQYMITFVVMFITAILTSSLASRLKEYARNSAQTSYRTKILLDTSQMLQKVSGDEEITAVTASQVTKLLNRAVAVYLAKNNDLLNPKVYCAENTRPLPRYNSELDRETARWVFLNRKQAGAGTEIYPSAHMLYLPIRIRDHAYGVVGVDASRSEIDSLRLSLLLSILAECALAMENEENEREKKGAAEAAHTQKLRADLLRSISHDLRTPLTSISGNASILLSSRNIPEEEKTRIYTDIYNDSMWLIEVVQNLLSVTRLEGGQVVLNRHVELMDEVIAEALRHVDKNCTEHNISTDFGDNILLAKADARLMVQVVVNLVNNAVKYTQKGSNIQIRARKKNSRICVSVTDDGPGISDDAKPHIFEMFYSGANRIADSRRSMGLGLALCKSIVSAHGGDITVRDNRPHGTTFEFWLPAEEVDIHEQ